jgi:hypothetical protein
MITYVRVRHIKAGKYQGAVEFLSKYKQFVQSELDVEVNVGTEVGRVGTVVTMVNFDNAQGWEDSLNKLRSSAQYAALLDESFNYFEDEIIEHLVTGLPS